MNSTEPAPWWKSALATAGKRAALPLVVAAAAGGLAVWLGLVPDPVEAVIGPLGMAWRTALIAGVAFAAIAVLGLAARRLSDRPVRPGGSPVEVLRHRMQGLSRLTWALGGGLIVAVAGVTVLGVLQIPIAPILTAAGVCGLALSLAAKTLLTNVIAGAEMLLDDAAAPGECVTAGGVTGLVRETGLRMLVLETAGGARHRIPNSAITVITNHSRGPSQIVLEVLIGYTEDPTGLVDAIHDAADAMVRDATLTALIPGDAWLALGVQRLDAQQLTARVQLPCAPMRGDALAREFRDRFGERIAAAGLPVRPPFAVTAQAATERSGDAS